jgi:uncharacterized protein YjbJ (UPF0337 family)
MAPLPVTILNKHEVRPLSVHTALEDHDMTDDRISGTAKNVGGKVQEGFGSLTGDRSQVAKGKAKQVEGAVEDIYGQAKDTASDIATQADDILRQYVENKPYTAAFACLALGFVIGRMTS